MRKNLRDADQYSKLAEHIAEMRGDIPVDYYRSPGNWGDSLINAGSLQFFANFGLPVRELSRQDTRNRQNTNKTPNLAVVGGGGGWNRNWFSTTRFVQDLSSTYESVIVLPSTYDQALLRDLDRSKIHLYTRSHDPGNNADGFCHDMALYCDLPTPAMEYIPYPLLAFRRDKERSAHSLNPDRNWDISLLGTSDTPHEGFLEIVGRFSEVITDRLHVAIAGAMLGKSVTLLDGNYMKNAGVYLASLRNNFPNVTLSSWDELQLKDITGMHPIGHPGYDEKV